MNIIPGAFERWLFYLEGNALMRFARLDLIFYLRGSLEVDELHGVMGDYYKHR